MTLCSAGDVALSQRKKEELEHVRAAAGIRLAEEWTQAQRYDSQLRKKTSTSTSAAAANASDDDEVVPAYLAMASIGVQLAPSIRRTVSC